MATKKKKKNNKVGFIFWFTFALLILICFLIAKEKINKNLGLFYDEVVGEKPSIISTLQSDKKDEIQNETTIIDIAPPKNSPEETITQKDEPKTDKSQKPVAPVEEKKLEEDLVVPEPKTKEKPKTEELKPLETPKIKLPLYFIIINEDGTITRKEILRQMNKTLTPLTASINALLQGPTAEEDKKGLQSVIPQGTKLLNASIINKTATLDFSEEFSFNSYGVEGYLSQLMQIVYTATSFTTIENVQFLIEGKKLEYIGEGVWIGTPLARSSFK